MTMEGKVTNKEYQQICQFLALPLNIQGIAWPLLTYRVQFIISILDCLMDGPKSYKEMAAALNFSTRTLTVYFSTVMANSALPLKASQRYPSRLNVKNKTRWERTWEILND